MKALPVFFLLLSGFLSLSCTSVRNGSAMNSVSPDTLGRILLNQVGYQPNSVKIALLRVKTDTFEIADASNGKIVFEGKPHAFAYWSFSGDSVSAADFSKLTRPGKYYLCINNKTICSYPFIIGKEVYADIAKASLKAFYLNRSGIEIKKEFAGKWARNEGHPDTLVYVHASAASALRPEGTVISSPGGWYDAGDYNKYIVNSGISTYTLLLFCQMYPEYCKHFNDAIPESGNGNSDVMNELLYNLRWMLSMQDPADGGVYHKLTNKAFGGFTMPDQAREPRYVVMKSTAASLDFAATMAMASRVFAKSESKELSALGKRCLDAAFSAMEWAKVHPAVYFKNPSDISTGAYDDNDVRDEFFWAGAELGLASRNLSHISRKNLDEQAIRVPTWNASGMIGIISLSLDENAGALNVEAQKIVLAFADKLVAKSETSPYKVSLDFFNWGSNSDVANMAVIKLVAYKLSGDKKYITSVQGDVDYLLGRNATAFCFVTGFGGKQVMNIHHRPSGSDGIREPYPGFLAGGPNTVVLNDCPEISRSGFPAKSYADSQCSYSTNEVAINWNAPLFFVLAALDALDN